MRTKKRYFWGNALATILNMLARFANDVYDDITFLSIQRIDSLPSASADYWGKIYFVDNSGVDTPYICRKNGSNYEWKEISLS